MPRLTRELLDIWRTVGEKLVVAGDSRRFWTYRELYELDTDALARHRNRYLTAAERDSGKWSQLGVMLAILWRNVTELPANAKYLASLRQFCLLVHVWFKYAPTATSHTDHLQVRKSMLCTLNNVAVEFESQQRDGMALILRVLVDFLDSGELVDTRLPVNAELADDTRTPYFNMALECICKLTVSSHECRMI